MRLFLKDADFEAFERNIHGTAEDRWPLSPWPLPRPRDWTDLVNRPQTEAELEAIRRSVTRGQPYGSETWTRKTAGRLGLESTMRRRGRPRQDGS